MVDSFLYWTLIVAFSFIFLYFFQSLLIGLLFTRKTRRPPIEKEDIWYLINYGFFFCYRFRFAIWFAAAAIKEIFCISFAAVLFCCWCYFTFSYCCMEEQLWSCLTETRFNATYLKQLFSFPDTRCTLTNIWHWTTLLKKIHKHFLLWHLGMILSPSFYFLSEYSIYDTAARRRSSRWFCFFISCYLYLVIYFV